MSKNEYFERVLKSIKEEQGVLLSVNQRRTSSMKRLGIFCIFSIVTMSLLQGFDVTKYWFNKAVITPLPKNAPPLKKELKVQKPQTVLPDNRNYTNHVVVNAERGLNVRIGPSKKFNSVGKLENGSCIKGVKPSNRNGWSTFHLVIISKGSKNNEGLRVYLSEKYIRTTTIPNHRCLGKILLRPKYKSLGY